MGFKDFKIGDRIICTCYSQIDNRLNEIGEIYSICHTADDCYDIKFDKDKQVKSYHYSWLKKIKNESLKDIMS